MATLSTKKYGQQALEMAILHENYAAIVNPHVHYNLRGLRVDEIEQQREEIYRQIEELWKNLEPLP
jgi:hypothetical protein